MLQLQEVQPRRREKRGFGLFSSNNLSAPTKAKRQGNRLK